MKTIALAIVIAVSVISTAAVASPVDNSSLSVHGAFGGNSYGGN
ncbi:hypothetical protein [Hyphomicrobium sp. MC8b]